MPANHDTTAADRRVRGQPLQSVSLYTPIPSADCHGKVYTNRLCQSRYRPILLMAVIDVLAGALIKGQISLAEN